MNKINKIKIILNSQYKEKQIENLWIKMRYKSLQIIVLIIRANICSMSLNRLTIFINNEFVKLQILSASPVHLPGLQIDYTENREFLILYHDTFHLAQLILYNKLFWYSSIYLYFSNDTSSPLMSFTVKSYTDLAFFQSSAILFVANNTLIPKQQLVLMQTKYYLLKCLPLYSQLKTRRRQQLTATIDETTGS
ncbi:hypothetical protein AGLY_002915 [Aphis glycines]|uniref:Uncharacterized protein n=1 Tax=Aphis glycines TaxID=307491 RepID=A0A6G0U1Q6_APHGL|nr:hypothetical protein AGLY_002915 [Aphis glycines]